MSAAAGSAADAAGDEPLALLVSFHSNGPYPAVVIPDGTLLLQRPYQLLHENAPFLAPLVMKKRLTADGGPSTTAQPVCRIA